MPTPSSSSPFATRNLRYALGNMIEDADTVNISTAQDVVRAAYAFAHIDDEGRWVHPTNKSEVVVSASRAPGLPTGSPARCEDGTAPGQPRLTAAPDDGWHPATLASPLSEVRGLAGTNGSFRLGSRASRRGPVNR